MIGLILFYLPASSKQQPVQNHPKDVNNVVAVFRLLTWNMHFTARTGSARLKHYLAKPFKNDIMLEILSNARVRPKNLSPVLFIELKVLKANELKKIMENSKVLTFGFYKFFWVYMSKYFY